jgi:hypothetical protein
MLDARDIDAIADALAPRLVELLRGDDDGWAFPTRGLVDVDDVCRLLRVRREWVYAHKVELGAVGIGDGERPVLRFEAAKVLAYIAEHRLKQPEPEPQRRGGRPRTRASGDFDLLEIPKGVR